MLFYLFLFLVQVNGSKLLEPIQENTPWDVDGQYGSVKEKDEPPLKIPVQNGTGLIQTILSDPKKFVENMVHLDPVAVETIVSMLEELRTTSETAEANLIAQLAARSEEAVITGAAVTDDKAAVTDAEAAVTHAQGQLTNRKAELAAAEGAHDDKLNEKNAAQKEHDDGVPVLQNEQDVINQVIEMLRGVKDSDETSSETFFLYNIRLTSYPQGRLQLFFENDWHTVCGHWFWDNNHGATTACKQLNYPGGGQVVRMGGQTISENDPIYVGTCLAGESIGQCTGGCCSYGCQKNALNCGDCQKGTNSVIEIQCLGDREE